MTNLDEVLNAEELPKNREFWLELNERLIGVGMQPLIVTHNAVFIDRLHEILGIGYLIEG